METVLFYCTIIPFERAEQKVKMNFITFNYFFPVVENEFWVLGYSYQLSLDSVQQYKGKLFEHAAEHNLSTSRFSQQII